MARYIYFYALLLGVFSFFAFSMPTNKNKINTSLNPIITGNVFIDFNNNGIFDVGQDYPFVGFGVAAYPDCNIQNTPIIVYTDAQGGYIFSNLPIPPSQYLIKLQDDDSSSCFGDPATCVVIDPDPGMIPPINFICDTEPCSPHIQSNHDGCNFGVRLCDITSWGDFPCAGTSGFVFNPSPSCFGSYTNVSHFNFYGMEGNYNIDFQFYGCHIGSGLQYGIYEGCGSTKIDILCEEGPINNDVSISSDLLEPCKKYTFWISGYEGAVCSYYLSVSGNATPCLAPQIIDLGMEQSCEVYCPKNTYIELTVLEGDIYKIESSLFEWRISGPDGSITRQTQGGSGTNITYNFEAAGSYEICVASISCGQANEPFCKSFVISELPSESINYNICTNSFPYFTALDEKGEPIYDKYGKPFTWSGGPITYEMFLKEPNYISQYASDCGCNYRQEIRLNLIELGLKCVNRDSVSGIYNENCICVVPNENFKIIPAFCQPLDSLSKDGTLRFYILGGTAPYNYKISNAKNEWNGVSSFEDKWIELDSVGIGTYYISVVDSLGEYSIAPLTIGVSSDHLQWGDIDVVDLSTSPSTFQINIKDVLGGVLPYKYSLVDTLPTPSLVQYQYSNVFSPIGEGEYIAIVKDTFGCEIYKNVTTRDVKNQIWGYVFLDFNGNGMFDTGETTFTDIEIGAFAECDTAINPTSVVRTDLNGKFVFNNLPTNANCYSFKVLTRLDDFTCITLIDKNTIIDHTVNFVDSIFIGCIISDCSPHSASLDDFEDIENAQPLCNLQLLEQTECARLPHKSPSWTASSTCPVKMTNTSFFVFNSGIGLYDINLEVLDCAGYGLDFGIEKITDTGRLSILCNENVKNGTINISSEHLEPCQNYILWLNGHQGSVCSFNISISESYRPCAPSELIGIALNTECLYVDSSAMWTAKAVQNLQQPIIDKNFVSYQWLISNESTTIMISEVGLDTLDLSDFASELGRYSICVKSSTQCFVSEEKCLELKIEPQQVLEKSINICSTHFPWSNLTDENGNIVKDDNGNPWAWSGGEISLDLINDTLTVFESIYEDNEGCEYKQLIKIKVLIPETPCDDGNNDTVNDILDENCICSGTSNTVNLYTAFNLQFVPNPTRGNLNIKGTELNKLTFTLYNVLGIKIKNFGDNCSENLCTLDMSDLINGVYWIEFSDGKTTDLQKIVKL